MIGTAHLCWILRLRWKCSSRSSEGSVPPEKKLSVIQPSLKCEGTSLCVNMCTNSFAFGFIHVLTFSSSRSIACV